MKCNLVCCYLQYFDATLCNLGVIRGEYYLDYEDILSLTICERLREVRNG